jgi:hypothetical protein
VGNWKQEIRGVSRSLFNSALNSLGAAACCDIEIIRNW